jgi:hypothetical protein
MALRPFLVRWIGLAEGTGPDAGGGHRPPRPTAEKERGNQEMDQIEEPPEGPVGVKGSPARPPLGCEITPTPQSADDEVAAWMSRRVRLPADAGEFTPGLEHILRRILPGRGRRIRVGKGWYSLITDLDRKIAAVDPAYRIFGVDAMFGELWYDSGATGELWNESVQAKFVDIAVLVRAAEVASLTICEACGQPGRLMDRRGWFASLCPACSRLRGYRHVTTSIQRRRAIEYGVELIGTGSAIYGDGR